MREIKITVEAGVGVGKSTVAAVMYDALSEAGFSVQLDDDDASLLKDRTRLRKTIKSVGENTSVIIVTKQLPFARERI